MKILFGIFYFLSIDFQFFSQISGIKKRRIAPFTLVDLFNSLGIWFCSKNVCFKILMFGSSPSMLFPTRRWSYKKWYTYFTIVAKDPFPLLLHHIPEFNFLHVQQTLIASPITWRAETLPCYNLRTRTLTSHTLGGYSSIFYYTEFRSCRPPWRLPTHSFGYCQTSSAYWNGRICCLATKMGNPWPPSHKSGIHSTCIWPCGCQILLVNVEITVYVTGNLIFSNFEQERLSCLGANHYWYFLVWTIVFI